ncbi:MAG: NAD-dependent epimerase/dehydratase family protein, partial [Gammaproteobacteria bacterium]
YIDDFISGLMATMMPGEGCRIFNFGSGHSYSVRDVVETIQQAAGTDLPVTCENKIRPNEIEDVRADNRRARHVLYWNPSTPFARGIKQTLEA